MTPSNLALLSKIHSELGITDAHLTACQLSLREEPALSQLEVVDIDFDGRPFILEKSAAEAWRQMRAFASSNQIVLEPISGFRSYVSQKRIIERKLLKGAQLSSILSETAIPGYSEHHSGFAVDLSSEGEFELNQNFEQTPAFRWLLENAHRFQFKLSYPRGNDQGIIYEPWHWCFRPC